MALPNITVYKTEMDKIVAALKVMWAAPETNNPHHPLRNLGRQMLAPEGIASLKSDTDYIDEAYAGKFPMKGSDINSKVFSTILALTTATVEDAAPTDIVLTFAEDVTFVGNVSVGGEAKVIDTIVVVGAVVTITVTVAYAVGNTINVSGNFQGVSGAVATLVNSVVTNNVI